VVLTDTSIRPSEEMLMMVSPHPAASTRAASGTRDRRRADMETLLMPQHLAAPWRFP